MEQGGTKARKGQQVFQEKGSTRTRGGEGGRGERGWGKGSEELKRVGNVLDQEDRRPHG